MAVKTASPSEPATGALVAVGQQVMKLVVLLLLQLVLLLVVLFERLVVLLMVLLGPCLAMNPK